MTHRKIRVLNDGTRVYADYHRYRPVPAEERKYRVNRPDDPRAVRYHGKWFVPLMLLDDQTRVMPETRPDTDAFDHASKPRKCTCRVCQRPEAERWREKYRRTLISATRPRA